MKTYQVYLNQVDDGDPEAYIIQNSVGDVVWTRQESGQYVGVLSGAFPAPKTFVTNGMGQNLPAYVTAYRSDDNTIVVQSANPQANPPSLQDNLLLGAPISITVND